MEPTKTVEKGEAENPFPLVEVRYENVSHSVFLSRQQVRVLVMLLHGNGYIP